MVREPVAAGRFYPSAKAELEEDLDNMLEVSDDVVDALGAVSPHAGYMFSGRVAGKLYGCMRPKDTYVVISPNHTGQGKRFSVSTEPWRTPLGTIDVDTELAGGLMERSKLLQDDKAAHHFEHSIEVQIPFIQKVNAAARVVPITVQHGTLSEYGEIASAITLAIRDSGKQAMVLASSDMTHYEPRERAKKKDMAAIKRITDLDPEGLLRTVEEMDISMCGYIPAAITLMAAIGLGAAKARLVDYSDSGEGTGDTMSVVGYAGIVIFK